MKRPFPLPSRLPPDLERVHAYWEGLLRAANPMPFWDDLDLTALPDLAGRLFVIGAFARPERFRFDIVGEDLARDCGQEITGLFADELELGAPFDFLRSQCSATIEAAAPTFYARTIAGGDSHSRLVLPMWGDGRTSMLLGAVDWSEV